MNERIQQLAIEAGGIWQGGYVEQSNGDSVYTDKKFVGGGDMDVEQFAELIVKECWTTISPFIEDDNLAEDALAELKEHFGVKE
jgi:hypothetical protein